MISLAIDARMMDEASSGFPPKEEKMDMVACYRFAERTASVRPSAIREILKVTSRPEVISFAGGLPAPELFPTRVISELAGSLLAEIGSRVLQYSVSEGIAPLREWVAARLRRVWEIPAIAEDVLILSGSQQALDLVAKVFIDPGDVVALEAPSYLGAIQAFDAYQATYLTIATDGEGIIPEELERALSVAPKRPKLLYLVPNFQNPSGVTLAGKRRERVVRICEAFEIPIFEDDPYGELRFAGSPLQPLASYPSRSPILYAGTGSKVMAPGLRVAWLVVRDEEIRSRIVPMKQACDLHTGTLAQYLFHAFVSNGDAFERHLASIRDLYGGRQYMMVTALREAFGTHIHFTVPQGGMFLWAGIDGVSETNDLLTYASERGVVFVPGEFFYANNQRTDGLRLSFSNTNEAMIAEGVRRLSAAIEAYRGR
jgi:2-aminoadipate transaminase